MFNRDWNHGLAFGLVVGIVGAILVALALGELPDNFGQTDARQNEGNQATPQDDRWWLIGRVVFVEDTAAQWLMVGVTIVATILVLRTLWATQAMAGEATRIGEAQVRAYVSIDEVSAMFDGENSRWHVTVRVKNFGQSPARNIEIRVENPRGDNPSRTLDIGDLGAGDAREGAYFIGDGAGWKRPGDRELSPLAKVTVTYNDVFGKSDVVAGKFSGFGDARHGGPIKLRRSNTTKITVRRKKKKGDEV